MAKKSAIDKVIDHVGGITELANYFKNHGVTITPQAIFRWSTTGKVPPARVMMVVKASGGKVTAHQLRPDIFPRVPAS